ncbi:MAG: ATP-binding protein [Lentisphaerae bacterium]|nr:ATP-binding protein [Lentisphaerota bacterium]
MAIAVITRIAAGNAIAIDFIGKWSYYNTLFQQKWAYFVIKYFFKRKALNDLLAWHNSSTRKPLVIRGARQVGKTSLVRSFATKIKCRFMELNLERPSHASIFKSGMSVNEVVDRALLECRTPTGDDPLLLFIDEIQEVPEAVAMLRFFYEERPDIHLIAAGSLLEVALSAAAISFPVGRVEFLYMRPMNFAEFLHAAGDSSLRDALHTIPAPLYAHDLLLKRFNQYALIGGMPEAVTRYVSTGGNLDAVNQVYADLFTAFRDDIPKYGRNETMRRVLLHTLESAPYKAGSRITFQGFGGSNYRSREAGEALRTLERAMLLELVYPTTALDVPLMPNQRKAPRLHFLDVGLANHQAGLQSNLVGIQDLSDVYRGRLIEQVIGQELKASVTRNNFQLCFWVRDKALAQAELDFVLTTELGVVPVEAKSGAAGKLRSLHQFVRLSNVPIAVRLYAGVPASHDVTFEGVSYRLINIPYYASSLIPEYLKVLAGR